MIFISLDKDGNNSQIWLTHPVKATQYPSFSRSLTTITWILLSGSPFFLLAPPFFAPCTSKGPEWTQIPCLSQASQASTKTTVDCQPKRHCCNLLTPPPNQPNVEKKAQSLRRSQEQNKSSRIYNFLFFHRSLSKSIKT